MRESSIIRKMNWKHFLHQSWSKLLSLPAETISIDDPFLALGGNSIKAYQFLDEIEKHLKREVGPQVLSDCKTIRQIAEYLQSMPSSGEKSYSDWQSDHNLDIDKAVAITGLALRLPHAKNQQEFWDNLCSKKDCITKISPKRKELSGKSEWNDWIGELENIDRFDNDFFEIPADEAIFMDPQQRLILETSYEALEDAGLIPGLEEERNIGVYAAINSNTYYQLLVNHIEKHGIDGVHQNAMVGNMHNIISALVARVYNFTGPALAIDTACSSFLVALHHAVGAIRQNSISGAVVAGANILVTPMVHLLSRKAGIVSSTNHTKVFDKDADGSVVGEGVVVIYLEPLAKAVQENKNIYGVIRGTAINNDGYSLGIMAPNPKGQYKVLTDAYKDANLSPSEISYIEAHGTGTAIGDPIEMNALSKLFSESDRDEDREIGIGSVKTNIGHLLPASGGAGLAKVLLCLKNQKLVPNLHMENINPALQLEKSPFYIVKDVENWPTRGEKTRKAGINSFGLGGTNAHVVLEEWKEEVTIRNQKEFHLLTLSAKSEKALESVIRQTAELIKLLSVSDLHNLCFTRNRYRKHYGYRAACMISAAEINLNAICRGQFLKKRPARISLMIDDLRQDHGNKEIVIEEEANSLFKKDFLEFSECADQHDIVNQTNFNRNELIYFTYWYSLVKNLKQNGANIFDISGIGSGQLLADLLNGKIDLIHALGLYFGKEKINGIENHLEDKLSQLRSDIVLGLGMSNEDLRQVLPGEILKGATMIGLGPEIEGSFDANLLSAMGELYAAGANFDWENLCGQQNQSTAYS